MHDERAASSAPPAVHSRTARQTLRPGASLRIQPVAAYATPAVVDETGLAVVRIEKLEPAVRATRAAPEPTWPSDASESVAEEPVHPTSDPSKLPFVSRFAGAAVTVQLRVAGVGSAVPPGLIARTANMCAPIARPE